MTIAHRLRKDAEPIWNEIINHSFVRELYSGHLSREKFEFYILQDYHYLVAAMRNFAVIASKAPSVEVMKDVIDILHLEATSEFDGYEELLKELGYGISDAVSLEPVPVSISYSGFLLSTSSLKSFAEAMAAVLPCFWSYAEIAIRHRDKLKSNTDRLYREWGAIYFTEEYLRLVEKMKDMVNAAGEDIPYEKLKYSFITSSRYEYMFWDAVYTRDQWPV